MDISYEAWLLTCRDTKNEVVEITVAPTVIANVDNTEICLGGEVTFTGSGADTYTWDNGVTDGVAFEPTAAGTITYTVAGTASGCTNTTTVSVIVNALPTVSLDPFASVCDNAGNLTLSGGTPAGGDYSGPGVSNGEFDPAAAGVGTHTITYTYEDANSCENFTTASIVVDPCVGIEAGNVGTLSVFPNPASSELNVVFENVGGAEATVVLTTTDGKVVYQTSAKAMSLFNEKINVTDFANGVYFISIQSETTSLVQRVVLN